MKGIDDKTDSNSGYLKRRQRLLTLVLHIFTISASAAGINFEYNSIHAASKAAKAEGKMIFLDAFTTWCGPGKMSILEIELNIIA